MPEYPTTIEATAYADWKCETWLRLFSAALTGICFKMTDPTKGAAHNAALVADNAMAEYQIRRENFQREARR